MRQDTTRASTRTDQAPRSIGHIAADLVDSRLDSRPVLIILDAGQGGGCEDFPGCLVAKSTGGDVSEAASITAQAGHNYYIVVDGYNGDAGAFSLSIGCP